MVSDHSVLAAVVSNTQGKSGEDIVYAIWDFFEGEGRYVNAVIMDSDSAFPHFRVDWDDEQLVARIDMGKP